MTDENLHPQNSYGKSHTQALVWLKEHEPVLWDYIRSLQPLDFLSIKNYSYGSAQVFSEQRWSCVGEAGFFVDPLYSPGSDFIAIENTITVELIRRELSGDLSKQAVEVFNRMVLEQFLPLSLDYYRGMYPTFGHAQIFTAKLFWDTALNWAWASQLFMQNSIRQPTPELLSLGEKYRSLNERVQRLFLDWSEAAPPGRLYVRGDMTRTRFLQLLHLDLGTRRSQAQVLEIACRNLDRFEELAQVLFWQAVEECYPAHPLLDRPPWIDAWKIVLDPNRWNVERLFEPRTAPRPLRQMRDNFTGIFSPQSVREILLYELPYQLLRWGKGFAYYHIVPLIHRLVFAGKPAIWARKLMVRDYPSKQLPPVYTNVKPAKHGLEQIPSAAATAGSVVQTCKSEFVDNTDF